MKSKIKIMKTCPQVTEQEISSFMDFDAVLKQRDMLLHQRQRANRLRKIIGLTCVALLAVLITVVRWKEDNKSISSSTVKESMTTGPSSTKVDSLQVAKVPGKEKIKDSTNRRPTKEGPALAKEAEMRVVPVPKDETKSAQLVYVQPEPVDGYPALYEYFDKALRYPDVDAKDSVTGIVTVAFVIDETGKATKITIENSLGPAFDQEARRLVQYMPLWRPATYDGQPVASKVSLPVTFTLEKNVNLPKR